MLQKWKVNYNLPWKKQKLDLLKVAKIKQNCLIMVQNQLLSLSCSLNSCLIRVITWRPTAVKHNSHACSSQAAKVFHCIHHTSWTLVKVFWNHSIQWYSCKLCLLYQSETSAGYRATLTLKNCSVLWHRGAHCLCWVFFLSQTISCVSAVTFSVKTIWQKHKQLERKKGRKLASSVSPEHTD